MGREDRGKQPCDQAGVPAGLLLANAVFNVFKSSTGDDFLRWGWRVPFLLGIGLLAVGLFIRLQVYESPLFAKVREQKRQAALPLFEVLRRYPRNILLVIGARMAENGAFYVFTVFVLTYAKDRDDVGVMQKRRRLGFTLEPLQPHGIGPLVNGEHLERDLPSQALLHRHIDDSHAAPADLPYDPEITEPFQDWRCRACRASTFRRRPIQAAAELLHND